jgi:hypothetical protein
MKDKLNLDNLLTRQMKLIDWLHFRCLYYKILKNSIK